ncbi:unnamed protein product [Oppiella nova]|uniref:THAP-type domain-containing protein n=1 Tax=Oppiella nova TaxID=334625 RepID=A0A7R9QEM9_9ACAR|nr:unnamed protein product [Oppiella nova]CAG2164265.1 unnamed protein product [Oppiella nova]
MSRNVCCVKSCTNTKHEKPTLSFHNFPTREPIRCKKWVEFCENETLSKLFDTNDPKLEHKSICSQHFEDNKYNNPMKKIRLMCNALPTIKCCHLKDIHTIVVNTTNETQSQPPVQVISAQLLLRTNLSRSWRSSAQYLTENETQDQCSAQESKLKSKSNPIIKHYSERHLRYESEIKNLRDKLKKSKKQVMNLRYRLKRTEAIGNTKKSKLNYIIKSIKGLGEEALNPVMSEIIEYHLTAAFLNKTRVQKWSNKMKKFCADLYHKSPSAYCLLQKTLTLPTKKTILKFTEERIQNTKNDNFKQMVNDLNTDNMDSNVSELIKKFTEQQY